MSAAHLRGRVCEAVVYDPLVAPVVDDDRIKAVTVDALALLGAKVAGVDGTAGIGAAVGARAGGVVLVLACYHGSSSGGGCAALDGEELAVAGAAGAAQSEYVSLLAAPGMSD